MNCSSRDRCWTLALRILKNGPLAVAASKRIVPESTDWQSADMFDRQAPIVRGKAPASLDRSLTATRRLRS